MSSRALRKRKKKKKLKVLKLILSVFLLLFIAVLGYGGYLTYKIATVSSETAEGLERGEKSALRAQHVDPEKNSFSILFIGVDAREGETNSRSDALILATFNTTDKTIKMVSIPRDSRVKIPGYKTDKINHAHFRGGKDLTVETVEGLFDIPVDYYVELNFEAFIDVVNALDGVTINSERAFTEQDSSGTPNAIRIEKGVQTLNGEEALAYVRMRKQDPLGDIGRGERQKEVIEAIINKSASVTSLTKYDDVIDSIGKNLTTNFSIGNILALQKYSGAINDIESLTLEGYDNPNKGVYYYELRDKSVEEISLQLAEHLELDNTN